MQFIGAIGGCNSRRDLARWARRMETAAELSASIAMGARLKLMGVETVQFHRLRLFPPSRLSRTLLSGEFDGESLRIEYPFIEVPPEDIEAIKSDKDFFAGYWTPKTTAGSKEQLAQVEMFFHHVVALAPLTIAAVGQFATDALIPAFYKTLDRLQPLKREKLDWETGDLFGNWIELRPLLSAWIDEQIGLQEMAGRDCSRAHDLRGPSDWICKRQEHSELPCLWRELGCVSFGRGLATPAHVPAERRPAGAEFTVVYNRRADPEGRGSVCCLHRGRGAGAGPHRTPCGSDEHVSELSLKTGIFFSMKLRTKMSGLPSRDRRGIYGRAASIAVLSLSSCADGLSQNWQG